jgi:hypothetical protein
VDRETEKDIADFQAFAKLEDNLMVGFVQGLFNNGGHFIEKEKDKPEGEKGGG